MAITYNTEPYEKNFSGNPVIVEVLAENADLYAGYGENAYIKLYFDRVAVNSEKLVLFFYYLGYNVTFTFKDTPAATYDLPAWNGVETFAAWLIRVKTALEATYLCDNYYDITTGYNVHDYLTFTAKTTGSQYNIDFTSATAGLIDSNDSSISLIDYSLRALSVLQLFIKENGVLYRKVVEDYASFFNLIAKHNLSSVIHTFLAAAYTFPDSSESDFIVEHTDAANLFYVKCCLYYPVAGTYGTVITSSEYYAIQGKVPHYHAAQSNELQEGLYQIFEDFQSFLTYAPLNKRSDVSATEKLYFFNETCDHLKLGYIIYYTDDTTDSSYTTEQDVTPGQVVEVMVSKLNTLFNTAKTVDKYEVWLEGGLELGESLTYVIISEVRTYTMDPDYYRNRREFLFKSDMYYDTIITRGEAEINYETAREFIELDLPDNFINTDRQRKQVNLREPDEITKLSTGWLTAEEFDYFAQFFNSDDVFEIIDTDKLVPVIITATKFFKKKDSDYLYAVEFDYEKIACTTNMPVLGEFNDDFNNDFNI